MLRLRTVVISAFAAVVLMTGFSGCEEEKPVTKTNPGAKRDEIQKKTQSGIPGKPAGSGH
jgi:hypothetical protein